LDANVGRRERTARAAQSPTAAPRPSRVTDQPANPDTLRRRPRSLRTRQTHAQATASAPTAGSAASRWKRSSSPRPTRRLLGTRSERVCARARDACSSSIPVVWLSTSNCRQSAVRIGRRRRPSYRWRFSLGHGRMPRSSTGQAAAVSTRNSESRRCSPRPSVRGSCRPRRRPRHREQA
jgi:hypothetical protein